MALKPGSKLGSYEILGPLGAGGMGEVYRARDPKLGREVAIKVLPPEVARDSERLGRFQREATLLAALNHPHIASIYGLDESDGSPFLVLELVEGEDLAARLKRGPIPVEEALDIARQVTEALESAHEKGIVHRDLKPANVKVTPDGEVKVLDFGLAKAWEGDAAAGVSSDLSQSPTLAESGTQAGVILGTAAYMAPEQARGKRVDKRADVWGFGVVLFEMLTGQRAFVGEDVTDTLAAVVRAEPEWGLLPEALSPSLRLFLQRCLHKDPRQRIPDIAAMRLALAGAFESAPPQGAARGGSRPVWEPVVPVAAAGLAAVLATGLVAWLLWPAPEPRPLGRFSYLLPHGQELRNTGRPVLALSRAGRQFVYNATGGLYLRSMDQLEARLIPGTEDDLRNPFFSPDGQWVGYYQDGHLKRIAVGGGASTVICPAEPPFGASWETDGTILFGESEGIFRVSASGGSPRLVVAAADGERLLLPQLLPDGKSVLFTVTTAEVPADAAVASLATGARTVLVNGANGARYLPTGHLVYAQGDALFGVAFDPERLSVSGESVPLVPLLEVVGLGAGPRAGIPHYAVSDNGTLVYGTGTAATKRRLVWVGRDGVEEPLSTPTRGYVDVSLSPNGRDAAVGIDEEGESDVWVTDLGRGTLSRITTDAGFNGRPLWSPEGRRIVFTTIRDGAVELRWKAADGTGVAEPIARFDESVSDARATSWSPDGSTLAIDVTNRDTGLDVGLVTVGAGDGRPEMLIQTSANEGKPAISPDGRWIAYQSDESGSSQVYVQRFPGLGDRKQVSIGPSLCFNATWSRDGSALLYVRLGPTLTVMRATVGEDATGAVVVGTAQPLRSYRFWSNPLSNRSWEISPDGNRFLMIAFGQDVKTDTAESPQQIIVVQNWFEELKRLVPAD